MGVHDAMTQKVLFNKTEFICPRYLETTFVGSAFWRIDNTCSFCGSLHPDTFMSAIQKECIIIPTDKNYKAYLDPDEILRKEHVFPTYPKFYFQHLSEERMKDFINLLNQKKLKIGYPGYFYNLPFFIKVHK